MKTNVKKSALTEKTHEGAPAYGNLSAEQQLRRSLLSCFLFENEFYEDGKSIADRIRENAEKVSPRKLADLAIEARTKFNLRHAPLLLLCVLAKTAKGTRILTETIPLVIRRADEMGELIALYWKLQGGKKPLSAQMKKGLAEAFKRFDAYQLGKYNRDTAIKLRDVMFLVHPKPNDDAQAAVWKQLVDKTLASPDTWEVALSGGADKKATFTRLIQENNLGYLALLRNLRNMKEAGVDKKLVEKALKEAKGFEHVLPFRFVAAARAVPEWEDVIDKALLRKIASMKSLPGKTIVLVDISPSMAARLSAKSDLTRRDAAAALACIIRADELEVYSFSNETVLVPPRRGMAGVDAVLNSQPSNGTLLGKAVHFANNKGYDRLIVITDEESQDAVPGPKGRGYMINVASSKHGVGYGPWVHCDGFSERVLEFIHEYEAPESKQ